MSFGNWHCYHHWPRVSTATGEKLASLPYEIEMVSGAFVAPRVITTGQMQRRESDRVPAVLGSYPTTVHPKAGTAFMPYPAWMEIASSRYKPIDPPCWASLPLVDVRLVPSDSQNTCSTTTMASEPMTRGHQHFYQTETAGMWK